MATTKVTTDGIDMSGNTGALTWVKGTTVEQPSGALGEIREDTTAKRAVVYTDQTGTSQWRYLKEFSTEITVSYLVIAGGGGGAGAAGNGNGTGGGGAGGYRNSYASETSGGNSTTEPPLTLSINTPYDIEVGAGGSGGAGTTNPIVVTSNGTQGGQSRFDSIISAGGGYGAVPTGVNPGGNGGSGGGGGNSRNGGTATTNQGFDGAAGGVSANPYAAGGGGGASATGTGNTSGAVGGFGGNGLESSIDGTPTLRAGGGGAGRYTAGSPSGTGTPGTGGGGQGGTSGAGSNGTDGTGGGGGGGAWPGSGGSTGGNGGNGGKGIVILRTSSATANFTSGVEVNGTTTTSAGQTVAGTSVSSDYVYSITDATAGATITFN